MKKITSEEYANERKNLLKALKKLDEEYFAQSSKEIQDYNEKLRLIFGDTESYQKAYPSPRRGIESKQNMINQWRLKNPRGTMQQCCLATGTTIVTVKKWWHEADNFVKNMKKAETV